MITFLLNEWKAGISPMGTLTLVYFDKAYCLFSSDSGKAWQSRKEIIRCWGKDWHIQTSKPEMVAVIVQIRFCRGQDIVVKDEKLWLRQTIYRRKMEIGVVYIKQCLIYGGQRWLLVKVIKRFQDGGGTSDTRRRRYIASRPQTWYFWPRYWWCRRRHSSQIGQQILLRLFTVVDEVAPRPIWTKACTVERATKLGFVLGMSGHAAEFFYSMRELALVAVFAGTVLLKRPA